jgi:adenosylhomocysteinase
MNYKVKDISLADQGKLQLEWAEMHMPALMEVKKDLEKRKPLKGLKLTAMLHLTKESGVLLRTLQAAGATISATASNPLSTQDDITAALATEGIQVYGWRGESNADYYENMKLALSIKPDILMDDGADLNAAAHSTHKDLKIMGSTEETTTGVNRLKVLEKSGKLRYPIIAVNNALTKYLFDNRYGTGQSTIDGVLRATNILISGKCAVVVGYGWVGRGIAMRLHGLGARVMVTEVNPFRALEAVMDGFEVMPMARAAPEGDLFISATGNKWTITTDHIKEMKDGAIFANSGHFDVEIDVAGLEKMAKSKRTIRANTVEYKLPSGRRVYLLAEGRLVNLGAAEGHPSEVMDLSFCNQALCAVYLAENYKKLKPQVYDVFTEIDEKVAVQKLKSMGIMIDTLTPVQKKYMSEWEVGT